MSLIKVRLSEKFNKEVLVGSQEEAIFVKSLDTHNKIRDKEAGITPSGATHDVVKDSAGSYSLKRFRMSGII